MSATRLLLRRAAYLIDTDPFPTATPDTDLLIDAGRVAAIGPDLPADGAEVIDASRHIVLPGFVDAHRHTWQTALRASTVDSDLGDYLDLVLRRLAPRYTPEDLRIGTLAGALECLDSGITTLQDYSHAMYSPDHADAAVDALAATGIRAVFGYGYPVFDGGTDPAADIRRVRSKYFASDDGLMTMAMAVAGPSYSPLDTVREDWLLARDLALPIVAHVGAGPVAQHPMKTLEEERLLTPGTLYVHGNSLPDDEIRRIAASGGAMAIAPAVEALMGHGAPMIGRLRAAGVPTGLGVDVVTSVAGDMFSLMRATLLSSHLSPDPRLTAADVLRIATLGGAESLGLSDRIGSLLPGKQADLVLLRADAPNLAPLTHDPIGAIVTAAHPGNVDTVIVNGHIRKQAGRLTTPDLDTTREALVASATRLAAAA